MSTFAPDTTLSPQLVVPQPDLGQIEQQPLTSLTTIDENKFYAMHNILPGEINDNTFALPRGFTAAHSSID